MKILDMSLHSFLAIGHADIPMDDQGSVLVTGKNKDDSTTDSNGSGKSSAISDGLTHCLYGKTMKGLSGSDVVNRHMDDGLENSIRFLDEEETLWRILRKRKGKHASMQLLEGKHERDRSLGRASETQELINKIIGMDFTTFACSVIFGQGIAKPFSAMTDSDQKKIFSNILDLGEIEQWRLLANTAHTTTVSGIVSAESSIETKTARLQDARGQRRKLKVAKEEWLTLQATKVEKMEKTIGNLERKVASKELEERRMKSLKKKEKAEKAVLVERMEALDAQNQYLGIRDKAVRKAEKSLSEVETAKLFSARRLAQFKKVGPTCDACEQDVPHDHAEVVSKRMGKEIKKLDIDIKKCTTECRTEKVAYKNEKVRRDLLEVKLLQTKSGLQGLNGEVKTCQANLDNYEEVEEELVDALTELNVLKKEKFAAKDAASDLAKRIPELKEQIKTATSKVIRLNRNLPYVEFWQGAFSNSGLPSFLLDTIAPYVSQRARKYSRIITGGNVYIEFQPVSKLKSGDYRDKFKILAISEKGADIYAGHSDGEKGKIDLCVGLALQDLVRSRSKTRVNVAVFDEATKNMDFASSERFIELLESNLVKAETKFVITHNEEFKGYFENELNVIKKDGIAKVEWS